MMLLFSLLVCYGFVHVQDAVDIARHEHLHIMYSRNGTGVVKDTTYP